MAQTQAIQLPTITEAGYSRATAEGGVRVVFDGKVQHYKRSSNYYVSGPRLRAMVLHRQADRRATFLVSAFPRKGCENEMPGRGRARFTGWEYVVAVTRDGTRCKVDGSGYWIDIDKLCFNVDLLD